MKKLLALVVLTAILGIGLSACTPDIVNEVTTSAQANPDNSSTSDSTNDLQNAQSQDQFQDQDQTIST